MAEGIESMRKNAFGTSVVVRLNRRCLCQEWVNIGTTAATFRRTIRFGSGLQYTSSR